MTNKITTIIQCFAVVEIYNSATGNVKSPLFTTVTQVFSRLLIVLGICQLLPESPANVHWCFITLCLSWSITEIIRYSYYASNLRSPDKVPYYLTWARYSLFYVLYPTGVMSEMFMVYLSLDEAQNICRLFVLVVFESYASYLFAWSLHVIHIHDQAKKEGFGKAKIFEEN